MLEDRGAGDIWYYCVTWSYHPHYQTLQLEITTAVQSCSGQWTNGHQTSSKLRILNSWKHRIVCLIFCFSSRNLPFKIQPNRSYQSGLAPPEYVDQIFWLCKYWLGFKLHGNGRIRLKRWWATFLSIFIFLDMKYFQILTDTIWTDLISTQSNHF